LERLRERSYDEVILWVLEENKNAIRFYERQGFECDDTVREIWRGRALRQVRYRKEL